MQYGSLVLTSQTSALLERVRHLDTVSVKEASLKRLVLTEFTHIAITKKIDQPEVIELELEVRLTWSNKTKTETTPSKQRFVYDRLFGLSLA